MNNKCEVCSQEWRERYMIAAQRFDRQINIATTVTTIAVIVSMFCIIIAAVCVAVTINFINGFEYVEETETVVQQDGNGQNIAVLVGQNGA